MINDIVWSTLIFTTVSVFFTLKLRDDSARKSRVFYAVLFLAFLLRAGVGIIAISTDFVPAKYYYDFSSYQTYANIILRGGELPSVSPAVENYAWLLSRLYLLIGQAPLTVTLLSGLMGTAIVGNIYCTTLLLTNRSAALLVAFIWAVLPSFVFVTAQTSRDSVIFLLISTIIYWMVRIEDGKERFPFLTGGGCLVLVYALGQFRPEMMSLIWVVLVMTSLAALGWVRKHNASSRKSLIFLGVIAAGFILFERNSAYMLSPFKQGGFHFFRELNDRRARYVSAYRKNVGTTAKMASKPDRSLGQFLIRFPLRVGEFLLSPFPWQHQSAFLKAAIAENLVFYGFLIFGALWLFGLPRLEFHKIRFVILFFWVSAIAHGLIEVNVGTAYRHRMQFIWLAFIPGAAYITVYFSVWRQKIASFLTH